MDFIDYFFLVTVSQFLLIGLIIGTVSLNKRFRKCFFIYIKEFWKRAFNITGKTKRNEFLIVQGFLLLKLILLEYFVFCLYLDIAVFPYHAYEMGWGWILSYGMWDTTKAPLSTYLYLTLFGFILATLIPSFTLQIRRLRDEARDPRFILISFLPFSGAFLDLFFFIVNSYFFNADQIKKYSDLKDQGIITEEEFQAKKKQLLDL